MEIYITGDLHGDLLCFQPEIFYGQEGLTKEDIILVCGDFGCVWHGDERDDEILDWLEGRPFTTTFVTGNHKNYEYSLEEWRGGSIRRIRPSVILLERGNHLSWWKEELSSEEEYQTARASLDRVGWEVDYILKL